MTFRKPTTLSGSAAWADDAPNVKIAAAPIHRAIDAFLRLLLIRPLSPACSSYMDLDARHAVGPPGRSCLSPWNVDALASSDTRRVGFRGHVLAVADLFDN